MTHQPDYIETYKILTVQSNLYDTKSEEIIWSATTETSVGGEFGSKAQRWIDSLVDGLLRGLTESHLLYPR
jgi:spore coat protein U-like protein